MSVSDRQAYLIEHERGGEEGGSLAAEHRRGRSPAVQPADRHHLQGLGEQAHRADDLGRQGRWGVRGCEAVPCFWWYGGCQC